MPKYKDAMPELHDLPLHDIQALILKPHGRHFVKCIFLKFGEDPNQTKNWIAQIVGSQVTSAEGQNMQGERYKHGKSANEVILCFYLSKWGYLNLNIPPPKDRIFRNGMKWRSSPIIPDPPTRDWQREFQDNLCAMILLAGNDDEVLQHLANALEHSFAQTGNDTSSFVENGKRLFYRSGNKKTAIEPFGFADGLSQPEFHWKRARKKVRKHNWTIVLDQDYGSYLVFRKLEQDVVKFNQKISDLSKKLNIPRELVEAQVIGRFKDGTPLTLFKSPRDVKSKEDLAKIEAFNKFRLADPKTKQINYSNDADGKKCPFHAHVRQVNPRIRSFLNRVDYDQDKFLTRIARRGIPYDDPGGGVGLLFMSFQRKLIQFITIQRDWANDPKFFPVENPETPPEAAGFDPIIGQKRRTSPPPPPSNQLWNKGWGNDAGQAYFDFSEVVEFRGGEYFYAPNISFLTNLGDN